MIFYSIPFLILFVVASVLLHFSKNTKQQHIVILLTNIIFYSYWDIRFLILLFLEIAICYLLMLAYSQTQRRILVNIAVVLCIAILGVFKYFNFFIDTLSNLFGIQNIFSLNLIVPLGVSFYTFQAISYIIDVYHGVIKAEKDFIKLSSYLSFFPQITSGPIVKARDFLPQLNILHTLKKENIHNGIQLFLLGLTKKVVFADRIGIAVDAVFNAPNSYHGVSVVFAALGYAIQIYCDFSGYSDMAIGIARIWGFDLGRNFNMPYLSKNPSDFWGRWHISLSDWFKEYVYIPLGGNRNGTWKTYRNLFITMLLSGIWHGANWTFVVWGILHGLYSVIYRFIKSISLFSAKKYHPVICIITNFFIVNSLWIVFRASNITNACEIFRNLFNTTGILYVNVYTIVFLVLMTLIHIYSYKKHICHTVPITLDLYKFKNKLILVLWIFLIAMFAYVGDSAFIYAQF